jgi:DNA polymerase I-like protein with 3'-5' exonuclease and polymerase domains
VESKTLPLCEIDLAEWRKIAQNLDVIAIDFSDGVLLLATAEKIYRVDAPLAETVTTLEGKILLCYDCKTLYKEESLNALRHLKLYDLMLAAYLVNSSKSNYEMGTLVSDYLGVLSDATLPRITYFLSLYKEIDKALCESGQASLLHDMEMPLAEVLADMEQRDKNDSTRKTAPLKPAEDAVHLDNSELTPDETVEAAIAIIEERRK